MTPLRDDEELAAWGKGFFVGLFIGMAFMALMRTAYLAFGGR